MNDAQVLPRMSDGDNRLIAAVKSETPRLRAFVRRYVADLADVEDIVQEAFAELLAAYRLMQPIEQVAGWLLRVARNRIIDRFRAQSRESKLIDVRAGHGEADPERVLDEWLAPVADGPDAAYARDVLVDELAAALDELPPQQRAVFVAHEIEGRSFKDLAASTGLGINTLLGRKHAAVRHLRRRLEAIYDEFDA
jgi:RNA polymerase sigma factor (sigma-70 family)